ncbi:MAG: DUF4258 domain-containing protein [Candidatus Omnitrophota bacterium]
MIEGIRKKFERGEYEYSLHAVDQTILRYITRKEILEMIENARIIEDYPDDKYGPSCLLYGKTLLERPLHLHCSYPHRDKIKIITVYDPDQEEWECFTRRRA